MNLQPAKPPPGLENIDPDAPPTAQPDLPADSPVSPAELSMNDTLGGRTADLGYFEPSAQKPGYLSVLSASPTHVEVCTVALINIRYLTSF